MIDSVTRMEWFQRPIIRRSLFGVLAVVLAILSLFPQQYRALVKLAPPDANTASLTSLLGQFGGANNALLASQPAEIDLAIARSYEVTRQVADRLGLVGQAPWNAPLDRTLVKLDRKLEIQALRGGILQIEATDRDPSFAMRLVDAYATTLRQRLSVLSTAQVLYKRRVLDERMRDAADRLRLAQTDLLRFRQRYNLPAPEEQYSQSVMTLNSIESTLQAREAALAAELQFATANNYNVQRLQAEIAQLREQVRAARQRSQSQLSTARFADINTRYSDLIRDERFAQSLYQAYARFLEGSAVEAMSAAYNLTELEKTHIDPKRQINFAPACLFVLTILLAVAVELYLATGSRHFGRADA